MYLTEEELKKIRQHQVVDVNGKRYALCRRCNRIIRVDRFLVGSAHICK